MADSRALPDFGKVDLDLEEDSHPLPRFGHVDVELDDEDEVTRRTTAKSGRHDDAEAPPASTSRAAVASDRETKATLKPSADEPIPEAARRAHEDATRVVQGDALSAFTRSKPPPPMPLPTSKGHPRTNPSAAKDARAAVALFDEAPSAGSESGIATRDARVAAMRELYANGDADAALDMAAALHDGPGVTARPASGDGPDASVCVQFAGEEEDPYGGLIPVEEGTVQIREPFAQGSESVDAVRGALSLTQRQSVPRVLRSPADIAKLPIDPRGGFLLAQVDGMQTLEEILDVCAMPAAEALEVIEHLQSLGVLEFE